jgi:hypothetical protein
MFDFARVIGPPIKPAYLADEKEPTALRSAIDFMGVRIVSRYGKHAELVIMAELVAALSPDIRTSTDHPTAQHTSARSVTACFAGSLRTMPLSASVI